MNPVALENVTAGFIEAARIACREIEQLDLKDITKLRSALADLLHAAEALSQCEVASDDSDLCIEGVQPDSLARLPSDVVFHGVFDPFDSNSVVAISFKDCLADIYASLKGGLLLLDREPQKKMAVLWEWRNDYGFHWGRHLVDAVRFLVLSRNTEVRASAD